LPVKFLVEVLEFVTGLMPEQDWSCLGTLATLVKEVQRLAVELGRCKRLILPPVWGEAGVYALAQRGEKLFLVASDGVLPKVGMAKEAELDASVLGEDVAASFGDYYLEPSFSTERAVIKKKGRIQQTSCLHLLLAQRATLPFQKSFIAIEDVTYETPPCKRPRVTPSPSDNTQSPAPPPLRRGGSCSSLSSSCSGLGGQSRSGSVASRGFSRSLTAELADLMEGDGLQGASLPAIMDAPDATMVDAGQSQEAALPDEVNFELPREWVFM